MDGEHVDEDSSTPADLPKPEMSTASHDWPEFEIDPTVRKRPRLDSGSKHVRSLSAEPLLPSSNGVTHPWPQMGQEMSQSTELPINPKVTLSTDMADGISTATETGSSDPEQDSRQPASPDVEIIDVDEDYDHFQTVMSEFPFSQEVGSPEHAASAIARQFSQSVPLFLDVLPLLRDWLLSLNSELNRHPADALVNLQENVTFWNGHIAVVFESLINRRYPFSTDCPPQAISDEILHLLRAYSLFVFHLVKVDRVILATATQSSPDSRKLISTRNLIALANFISNECLLVRRCLKESCPDGVGNLTFNVAEFLNESNRLWYLVNFTDQLLQNVQNDKTLEIPLAASIKLVTSVTVTLTNWSTEAHPLRNSKTISSYLHGLMLRIDQTLTANIEKQGKYLSLALRQKLVQYATLLLPYIARTDEQIDELLSTLLGQASEADFEIMVPLWQVKIARTYITKGRMDLRVAGASLLSDELDRICYQYGHMNPVSGHLYPGFRRIAQTIVDQKLPDAILGVDSHEQIIAQSRGIAKYLIITKDHGHELLDLIWNTIINGQNPGTVRATTELLGYLLNSAEEETLIMSVEDVHYVCEKIRTSPPMILGASFLDTISNLFRPLSLIFRLSSSITAVEELATNSFRLYLELIGIARKSWNNQSESLLQRCRHALLNLAPIIPDVSRKAFYSSCLDIIRARSFDADAVFDAMNAIFGAANGRNFLWKDSFQDLHMLVQELNLTETLIGDMQWFVSERLQVDHNDDPLLLEYFKARVTFLLLLIEKQPDCVTDANFEILWNCLVGDGTSNTARGVVWDGLIQLVKNTHDKGNKFLDQIITEGLANVHQDHFTTPFMNFLKFIVKYLEFQHHRDNTLRENSPTGGVIELVWRLLIETDDENAYQLSSDYLATYYLDTILFGTKSLKEIVSTHVEVVHRCLSYLESAFTEFSDQQKQSLSNGEFFTTIDKDKGYSPERHFQRVVTLLGKMVCFIQRKRIFKEDLSTLAFRPPPPPPPDCDETFLTKFQVEDGDQLLELELGRLETRQELEARLHQLTGIALLELASSDRCIRLLERPMQTLGVFLENNGDKILGIRGLYLDFRAWCSASMSVYSSPRTSLERIIIGNFATFYKFLWQNDTISQLTYTFLNLFAPPEEAIRRVAEADTPFEELFPTSCMYRCMYTLRCLQAAIEQTAFTSSYHTMTSHTQEKGPIRICRRGVNLLQTFLCSIVDVSTLPGSQRGLELVHSTVRTFVTLLNGIKYETRLVSVEDSEEDISDGNIITNGGKLMRQILAILKLASQIHQESAVISCYHLALVIVLHSPEAWVELRDHADAIHVHQKVLLQLKQSEHIGDIIEIVLQRFSTSHHLSDGELLDWFWNIVIKLIPDASVTTNSSKPLFDLAVSLFKGRYHHKQLDTNDCKDLQKCIQEWAHLLQNHGHYEVVGRDEADHTARGLSILLKDSFELIPALVEETSVNTVHRDIWSGLLFPYPSLTTLPEAYVLEDETRGALYELLNQICKDRKYLKDTIRLIQKVTELHEPRSWLYDTETMLRSSTCYVGLRNLRNTCYMNALLQQLFMNVPFRAFMLKAPNNEFDPSKRLLAEVQKLFGFMQNSFVKAYRTGEFTKCMRGIGNTEIDPSIQMDVEEFLNCVFDQWEAQLESHSAKEEFRSFYGGKQVTQTKSKECPHVSVREDPYSVIQCNIHGVSSLEQSLKQYVDGEEMEGANRYKCEQCDEKLVTAVRRSRLHQIPNNIIFHLMRFEYDIATGTRRKLNAYLSFPLTIDMNPYTYDHLVDPEAHQTPDMFELVGVLIHSGEADHGHYISYSRVRPTAPGQPTTWLEFDDEYVSYFAPECMEEKFFGGLDKRGAVKSHSAYMLFYQRASTLTEDPQTLKTDASGVLKVQLPAPLKEQIDNKNVDLLRTYCLHQTQHQDFINKLLTNLPTVHEPDEELHKDRIRVIRIACQHIWQVFSRKYDVTRFGETINALQEALGDCVVCNDFAVRTLSGIRTASERISRLHDLTLFCPHERVRSVMRSFFIGALHHIRGDRLLYGLDITADADGRIYTRDGSLINILSFLLEIQPIGLVVYSDAWDDYFGLLSDIAAFGHHEANAMISMGFVEPLLRILVIRVSPEISQEKPFDQLFNFVKEKNPPLDSVIETVYMLLQHIDLSSSSKKLAYYQAEAPSLTASESDLLMLSKRQEFVWLSEALWSWSGDGARSIRKFTNPNVPEFRHVAQFVSFLLKEDSHFADTEKIAFTIRRGFDEQAKAVYERGVSSNHLYAAAEFCKSVPVSTHTQKILDAVNQSVRAIHTTAAEGFFYFYHELLSLDQDASDDNRTLFLMVLWSSDIWGYALLRSQYFWVRDEAHKLLMSTLLDESSVSIDTTIMREQRLSVVRSLFRDGLYYLEGWLLNGTDADVVPKSNLKQLMNVLTACWTYMLETCTAHGELAGDDDQKLLERFADCQEKYNTRAVPATPSEKDAIEESDNAEDPDDRASTSSSVSQ